MSVYVQPCQYELIKVKTNIIGLFKGVVKPLFNRNQIRLALHFVYMCLFTCFIHIITSAAFRKRVSVRKKTNVSRYPHLLHVYLYNIIYKNTQ